LPSERVEWRLVAILAADVAGYGSLMGADDEGTLAKLKDHRRTLVDPKITEHRGRIVKTTGDGMLAEFVSVVDALRCTVEDQRSMAERNSEVPREKRIGFRQQRPVRGREGRRAVAAWPCRDHRLGRGAAVLAARSERLRQ
jgi:adenylate cyclase